MRRRGTVSACTAIAAVALLSWSGSSSVAAAGQIASQSNKTKASDPSGVVQQVIPLHITRRVQSRLIGSPPAEWALTKVAMATAEVGWAAATGLGSPAQPRLALATADGGRAFSLLFTAPESIVAVSAPDAEHAYFLEQSCQNGGGCSSMLQSWSPGDTQPVTLWSSAMDAAIGLSFPTAQDGYLAVVDVGSPFRFPVSLYATHDGGQTFAKLPLPCGDWNPNAPGALDFWNANSGWLLCGGRTGPAGKQQVKSLWATDDGGLHWSLLSRSPLGDVTGGLPAGGFVESLDVAGPQVGYVGIDGAGLFRTEDGGRTWQRTLRNAAPAIGLVLSVGFLPGGFGWLLAGELPQLETTPDGGRTWSRLGQPSRLVPEGFAWEQSGNLAFALGEPVNYRWLLGGQELIVSSDTGGHWARLSALPEYLEYVQVLSPQEIVAVYGRSEDAIERSSDLGQHWSKADRLPKDWQPIQLGYFSASTGWALAQDPKVSTSLGILRCVQNGCSPIPTPFSPGFAQATGPSSGFAIGQDWRGRPAPALFTTRDSGRTWTENLLPSGFFFSTGGARGALRWLYEDDSFSAVMDPRPQPQYPSTAILRSDDGGRTWLEAVLPAGDQTVLSVSFSDAAHGLLVTSSPVTGTSCWETSDGGATFHLVQ